MHRFSRYCRIAFLALLAISMVATPAMAIDPKPSENGKGKKIVPELDGLRLVLRDKAYIDRLSSAFLKLDGPESVVVSTPFSPSVVLILVSEQELSSSHISQHDLAELSISREDAIALGRKQVLAQLPPLPGPADFANGLAFSPQVDYVASMMLADGWDELADALEGTLMAAVPSDDRLVLAHIVSDKMFELVKTYVVKAYADANRSVSQSLFVRKDGAWVEFE